MQHDCIQFTLYSLGKFLVDIFKLKSSRISYYHYSETKRRISIQTTNTEVVKRRLYGAHTIFIHIQRVSSLLGVACCVARWF
jgi:hypothetical protein